MKNSIELFFIEQIVKGRNVCFETIEPRSDTKVSDEILELLSDCKHHTRDKGDPAKTPVNKAFAGKEQ